MKLHPQRLVEHALETSSSEQCIAIVHDTTSANLRWANNTLTTNGVMHGVHVSVVSFVHQSGGVSVGSVSTTTTGPVATASASVSRSWTLMPSPPPPC
jgi:hypothetical protein